MLWYFITNIIQTENSAIKCKENNIYNKITQKYNIDYI